MKRESWWTPTQSTRLSLIVTWIALAAALACLPLLWFLPSLMPITGSLPFQSPEEYRATLVPLYLCLLAGIVALILLLRLLGDIHRGDVFTMSNVNRLKAISYCGFFIMLVAVAAAILAPIRLPFIIVAVLAGFLGLLMRVIKNVIDRARELKEESDYTI